MPLACRGLSLEPLIGPIKLKPEWLGGGNISWPVIGGESGPDARTCQVEWIRSLVQQGEAAGVPVFVKQLGSNHRDGIRGTSMIHDRKGGDPSEWTGGLRIQQWPEGF